MQLEFIKKRMTGYYVYFNTMKKTDTLRICKRCNRRNTTEIICQSCKTELISNFEVSSDWRIAFEMEKVQQYTARYFQRENDLENN